MMISLEEFDYTSLVPPPAPGTTWTVTMISYSPEPASQETMELPHSTLLVCHDAGTTRGLPISRSTIKPALPTRMILSNAFLPHADALKPFLDTLPAPFSWTVSDAGLDAQDTPVFAKLELTAGKLNKTGGQYFRQERYADAVEASTDALKVLEHATALWPQLVSSSTCRLRAALIINRTMARICWLDDEEYGKDEGQWAVLRDAHAAEEADPTYLDGYLMQAFVYNLEGNRGATHRREVLQRALGNVSDKDVPVVKMLDKPFKGFLGVTPFQSDTHDVDVCNLHVSLGIENPCSMCLLEGWKNEGVDSKY
ncbi:hypothetical protein FA95DRAFT_1576005 [Auriscalpium vulgare]|uniref:Uncharacterized protein n=1 Tax=Auriscalpium vulgare TaxID=40419 RepID=A0ACB8REG3_9AGAM|nr:hypothetical protein FA95DRAFT_1576005 [Auriscalpium vulgare]